MGQLCKSDSVRQTDAGNSVRRVTEFRNRIWLHFTWRELELQRTSAPFEDAQPSVPLLFETCSFRRFRRRRRLTVKDVTRTRRLLHLLYIQLYVYLSTPSYLSHSLSRSTCAALSSFKSHNPERARVCLKSSFQRASSKFQRSREISESKNDSNLSVQRENFFQTNEHA